MFQNFWSYISEVPFVKSDAERTKYSILRGVIFSLSLTTLSVIILAKLSNSGTVTSHDVIMRNGWLGGMASLWCAWFVCGTRYYRFSLLPWAFGYCLVATVLITSIRTDAAVYRAQIFLFITLLIFSVYLRKWHLYAAAALFYFIILISMIGAGLFSASLFLPYTLGSLFAVGAMELVTRIRAAEAHMIEVERARALHSSRLSTLGETTAFLVHEVASPLTILNGHLALIGKKQNTEFHIERMQNAMNRALDFMESVKRMVRASGPGQFEVVQLSEILKMVSDLIEPSLRRKGIRLEFDYSDDIELKCRPAEIAQVLLNLLNNSSDAMDNSSEKWIKVSCKQDDGCLDIEVTDRGSGIDAAVATKIMTPFFTTKIKGSGIGLSIAQQVALHHDGRVDIVRLKDPTVIRLKIAVAPLFTAVKNKSLSDWTKEGPNSLNL